MSSTLTVVNQFGDAFAHQDVDTVMELMTDDCVFESTSPPDGERIEGHAAVRAFWEGLFAANPKSRWETEETIVAGDRAVVRWCYWFNDQDDAHVRGVDVITVRDGKVSEKYSYVKG